MKIVSYFSMLLKVHFADEGYAKFPRSIEMKHLTTIKFVAATGVVLGTLNATASGFGGGWVQDKHTGTAYNSLAPTHSQDQVSSDKKQVRGDMNSFGGGWVQDKNTGTAYNSLSPTIEQGIGSGRS